LFREAVISFLVDESKLEKNVEKEFCKACKIAKKNIDCNSCKMEFEVKEQGDFKEK